MELGPRVIFSIGPVDVTETVCFAWLVSIVILIFAYFATRRMTQVPKGAQTVGEILVGFVYNMVKDVMGDVSEKYAPYIGTLIVFLGFGSMLGLLELRPITSDLNCTAPLALVTFVLIHYNAVKAQTARGYIKELASPYAFMLPLNIISETIFPVTLACRIFGNILAGVIIMSLVYGALETLSEMLVPIPLLQIAIPLPLNFWFDMFEPVLQAYIFCMLTMVFIDNGTHPVESD
ncbi:MAG: F0F1 ATP synthase subunit A [Eubacteriales bacterium]|nr:F0F1 ATP synthase subunit A [Eubacteriales bacterium]